MNLRNEVENTIKNLITNGKGIFAADESIGTMGKRLKTINKENTIENRTEWRRIIADTEELEYYISGIILCEETLKTKIDDIPLINKFSEKGIMIGIKVDLGLTDLSGTQNEKITLGLDTLGNRCKEYFKLGARFSKWRVVFNITDNTPSDLCIEHNLDTLCRYAVISLANGLVPLVEPEILMDGTHEIDTSYRITRNILSKLFLKLNKHNINLEHILLKPNMVRPGVRNKDYYNVPFSEISKKTITVLQNTVPILVNGIMFLSGGMSEKEATCVLNEIAKMNMKKPWYLSFSFGRGLQKSALLLWDGNSENIKVSQNKIIEMCRNNSLAVKGEFK